MTQFSVLVWHSPVSLCDTILFPIYYSTAFLKATTLAKGPPVAYQSCVHVGMHHPCKRSTSSISVVRTCGHAHHRQEYVLPLACLILIGLKFVCMLHMINKQGKEAHRTDEAQWQNGLLGTVSSLCILCVCVCVRVCVHMHTHTHTHTSL